MKHPGFENKAVVMRFAPNPSGPLHIGHARAAVLNDELAKSYNGKLILRIEDTDPKRVDTEAYDLIEEDLEWLGVEWDEKVVQSDRLDIYADYCRRLIEKGFGYVCDCDSEKFRTLKLKSLECEHRSASVEENLSLFEEMKDWKEGRGAVKLKTDLAHPNPAVRDYPIMRVVERKHPRTGEERGMYPLMNFSVAVDDHLLRITHVLRGKDHIINTERQRYIYEYFNWHKPVFIHYGLMRVEEVLSTSEMRRGIERGDYSGWDDVKLWTLKALKRRGIRADAVRNYMLDLGVKEKDIEFSPENLCAENKKMIDPAANRYFFIPDPVRLVVKDPPSVELEMPLHKDFKERGSREFILKSDGEMVLFISKDDAGKLTAGEKIRLMNLFSVEVKDIGGEITGEYVMGSMGPRVRVLGERGEHYSKQKESIKSMKKVQWLAEDHLTARVLTLRGEIGGFCEKTCRNLRAGDIIQFERFGFCRLDERNDELTFYFTHK